LGKIVNDKVHGVEITGVPSRKYEYIWRDDVQVCNYCGSISPEDALIRLLNPDVDASGADWKYGWPHKFYIRLYGRPGKFYNKHLYDASNETFKALTKLMTAKLGITFSIDSTGLRYQAPYEGYQTWTLNNA